MVYDQTIDPDRDARFGDRVCAVDPWWNDDRIAVGEQRRGFAGYGEPMAPAQRGKSGRQRPAAHEVPDPDPGAAVAAEEDSRHRHFSQPQSGNLRACQILLDRTLAYVPYSHV